MKIIVDNSYCKIKDLDRKTHKTLQNLLSYTAGSSFSRLYRRSLLSPKGVFASGLLYRVLRYLKDAKLKTEIVDARVKPTEPLEDNIPLVSYPTPYPEQLEAVKAAKRVSRGIIRMPTGTGKSLTLGLLINARGLKTLVVVPNLGLKRQLQETLTSLFGKTDKIVVENIDSSKLNKLTDFDCLIIDEAHHAAASTYRRLNRTAWKNIYYRYCFTATPFRADPEELLLMESVTGKVIYSLSYETAVSKGYIVPVEAYYIDLPRIPIDGYTWHQVYNEAVISREDRNQIIVDIFHNLTAGGASTLVLVKEIVHGQKLSNATQAGFAHGEAEDCQMLIEGFSQGKLTGLIATTGVCGEGVDTKPAEYIIIAGLGKSKNAFMQQVGRAVRRYGEKTSAKIILIRDPSHKWTLAHFNAQRKILKDEYGIKVFPLA